MYPGATSIIGKEIDGYLIEEILGRGGMGIVYKAENQSLGRMVALKMIAPELAEDEEFLKRFRREARALAQLDHPHIVHIFALREVDLGLYIAMEYVEGQMLADYLKARSPIAWPQALPLIKQLLSALDYAHGQEIIHRDLKPRNIMLTEQGKIKVMDFGLAKMLGQGSGETTVTGARGGTLCYMSPEQARGLKNVDHRSDLFSLGLTLYEMLAGRLPFKKDDSDFIILKAIVEEKFPSPHSFNKTLPRRLSKILMKALEKNPAKRYQSAGEMLADIEAFEKQEPATDEATHVVVLPSSDLLKKRRGGLRLAAFAVVLVALTLVGYFVLPGLIRSPASSGESSGITEGVVPPPEQQQGQGDQQTGTDEPATEGQDDAPPDSAGLPTEQPPETQPEEATETQPVATTGSLRIQSDPPGARIFLGNTSRGTTPRNLNEVRAGRYTVELRLEGYEAYTERVVVEAQQRRTVSATLVPVKLMGVLEVTARPSGRLSIDGVARDLVSGTTSFDVAVGSHTVTIKHDDFGEWERKVTISTDTPTPITVDFDEFVSMTVIAVDAEGVPVRGSEIFVDGVSMGKTPRTVPVRVGLHRIEVRAEGYVLDGVVPRRMFEQNLTEPLQVPLGRKSSNN